MRRTGWSRVALTGVAGLLLLLSLAPASASSANISHSYNTSGSLPNGSLVSLDPARSDYVQAANTNNGARLLGLVVNKNDSLLAVDSDRGSAQVATDGTASALVSDINGAIKVGDKVSVSPFNGTGMKAPPSSHVIGLAQTAFDSNSAGSVTQSVTDKNGKSTEVHVGYVRVSIAVGVNSTGIGAALNSLQRVVQSITGRTVSTTRILLAMTVTVIAMLVLITLIYTSIYGSIISVGRNPLAKHEVFRTLGSVLGMVAATASVAAIAVIYLLR